MVILLVFCVAAATDQLDGKLRAPSLVTDFGRVVDPIADKALYTQRSLFEYSGSPPVVVHNPLNPRIGNHCHAHSSCGGGLWFRPAVRKN